jgi:hypothetical protein
MWRAAAAAVAVVLGAASGVVTALVSAHSAWGLWAALAVLVLVGAVLQGAVVAGERRSRQLPSDRADVSTVREAAERLRQLELQAARDGMTWPGLPGPDSERWARAVNALGSRTLVRSWERYVKAAQDHARLLRGGRTPPASAEFSARGKADRAYSRLMVRLRRIEER